MSDNGCEPNCEVLAENERLRADLKEADVEAERCSTVWSNTIRKHEAEVERLRAEIVRIVDGQAEECDEQTIRAEQVLRPVPAASVSESRHKRVLELEAEVERLRAVVSTHKPLWDQLNTVQNERDEALAAMSADTADEEAEPDCSCYEVIGGHQPGCAFHALAVKAGGRMTPEEPE